MLPKPGTGQNLDIISPCQAMMQGSNTKGNTMQSLPTALTTAQLEGILSGLSALPSAQVTRHPDVVTVHATRKATGEQVKVLSAVTSNGTQWHVMAVPGLISTTFTN